MKQHTLLGGKALSDIEAQFHDKSFLTLAKEIAYYHHEQWDGSGYPKGIKGSDIPLSARVTAVADVYDALCSKRCYQASIPTDEVEKIITEASGTMFDPDIVNAFLARKSDFVTVHSTYQNN